MAIIDFPSSPSVNDTYSFGNKTWVFNGQGWQLASTGAINDIVIGNITPASGNFTTVGATGNITASGNIAGSYILGNGAFLTGIAAGYSNANVKDYLGNFDGNIIPSANVTYDLGSNTNRWNDLYLNNSTIYIGAQEITANASTTVFSGNVAANYLFGNAAFLVGVTNYSNANVANYLPNYQGLISNVDFRSTSPAAVALVVTDRPLTMGGNSLSYVTLPDDGNANSVAAELTNHGLGNVLISAGPADYEWIFDHTGNLTLPGSSFAVNYANGQQVSLAGSYSNINVKAYLESGATINANFGGGTLKATGTANLGPTTVNGNLTVAGNISATGNLTYINVQDLVIDDPLIQLAANNPGDTEDLGIVAGYNDGTAKHTGIVRDYTDSTWKVFANVTSDPNTVVAWSQAVYAPFKAGPILSNASITANANITATGNVSGTYLLGNGYFISGIQYSNITGAYSNTNVAAYLPTYTGNLASLTGNVVTSANVSAAFLLGNIRSATGGYGDANVSAYLASNSNITLAIGTGNITTQGNITGNYILGNGALLTGLPATYSNANVANYLPTYTGNISAGNLNLTGNIVDTGPLQIITAASGNIGLAVGNSNVLVASTNGVNVTGYFSATGDISTQGNITVASIQGANANTTIVANVYSWAFDDTGNLTLPGNSFAVNYANGTQVSLGGSYSNSEAANYLASNAAVTILTTGNITTSGNIAGNYFIGNGALLTGLPATYSNANVANYLPTYTGNVSAGNLNLTGNIVDTGALTMITGSAGNITLAPNSTSVLIATTTGVNIAGYMNATGNVSGTYLLGNGYFISGIQYSNITGTYGNSNVAAYLPTYTGNLASLTGNVTTSANVSGAYILGNGAFLSGLPATYSNSNVAAYLAVYNGNALFSNITVSQDAVVLGNLRVEGNTTYINVSDLVIEDKDIIVAANASATLTDLNGAGLQIGNRSAGGNITFFYNSTSNVMSLSHGANIANVLNVAGNITATGNTTSGNVNLSGNIVDTGALSIVTGAAGNITLAPNSTSVLIATTTGVNIAGYLNTTGNISAGNVIGSGNNVEVTAGSYNWAFDNTGNFTLSGNTFAVNYANGTAVSIAGTYSNTNVAAYLASNAAVTILTTANITTAANIAGNYILGNGAFLTGLPEAYGNANVANYLPTYTGNVGAGNLNLTGNIVDTGALTIITGSSGNITLAPGNTTVLTVTTTGVNVSGTFNATGNISAGNVIGSGNNVEVTAGSYNWAFDNTGNFTLAGNSFSVNYANGSQISLSGTYSNTNVAAYLPTYTGAINSLTGNVTTTANVSGNFLLGNIRSATGGYNDANVAAYTGALANLTGNVTTTANVSATYLLGNGYFVSGIQYGNISGAYSNATVANYLASNAAVTILTTGNITTSANISAGNIVGAGTNTTITTNGYTWTFDNTGVLTAPGNIITTGNITANYVLPQSNATTDLGSNTLQWRSLYVSNNTIYIGGTSVATDNGQLTVDGNLVVTESPGGNISTLGNVTGGNLATGGAVSATGNVTGGNLNTGGAVSATGNVTGGNILTGGLISATGNLTSGNIKLASGVNRIGTSYDEVQGTGGHLTILAPSNKQASQASDAYSQLYWTNNIANVDPFNGNDNFVWAYVDSLGFTLGSNNDNGNVVWNKNSGIFNVHQLAASSNVTAGGFSTAGNLTASYLLGNGAFITGLPAGYSNADVANYLASNAAVTILTTGNITTTGNIAAGNISVTANIATDNLNVGTLLDVKDINITGAVLTNFNVQGNISGGNLEVTQDAVILGNLRVQGNTTYINVTDLVIEDKDIIVGANASAVLTDLNGAGLQIGNISAGGNITFFYNSTSNTMALSHGANIANTVGVTGNIDASGNISGAYILGNGSQLTGISAGAVIADDTTTNSNYYPVFATATSGSLTTATISSTKLTFNPSSGTLTAVDVNTSSDAKFKENVQQIASAVDTINSIQGVSFNWKETGQRSYGIIAQELAQVLPELVHSAERGLTVSYLPLIAILIEAIKEQQQQIDQLKNTRPS